MERCTFLQKSWNFIEFHRINQDFKNLKMFEKSKNIFHFFPGLQVTLCDCLRACPLLVFYNKCFKFYLITLEIFTIIFQVLKACTAKQTQTSARPTLVATTQHAWTLLTGIVAYVREDTWAICAKRMKMIVGLMCVLMEEHVWTWLMGKLKGADLWLLERAGMCISVCDCDV